MRMRSLLVQLLLLAFLLTAALPADAGEITISSKDWPWWRGPNRNGIAPEGQTPPVKWSASDKVVWKAAVPGRGHGSPTVVGNQVLLATADEDAGVQSVVCYDRNSGDLVWTAEVHKGGLSKKGNRKSTQASSTVACDGTRLFINFLNDGAAWTTALTRDGKRLWQERLTDYTVHQGYGSSPAIYGPLVIVSADNKGESGGVIAGLDRESGKTVWKHSRPGTPNYPSPIPLRAAGRDQVILTGCNLISSFDPLSGKKLWETAGATTECVTSAVTDGNFVFTSGGYPKNHMSAVRADGSREIVWENKTRVYVPSMLVHDGNLYGVLDAGVAACWSCKTGEELWKHRLGGTFTSSPILAAGHIYATNEVGTTFVFKARPDQFEQVAENQLGTGSFATPAICGSRIYARVVDEQNGMRQEMLYCLGENN